MPKMKFSSILPLLILVTTAVLHSNSSAQQIPADPMKYKTFYDTTKIKFDGVMWFEEIPGKKGYFLVAELNGKVWVLNSTAGDGGTKTLYMDFPTYHSTSYREEGLICLAFHPKFTENRKLYAFYTPVNQRSNLAIGEFLADSSFLKDSGMPEKILWSAPIAAGHNGATLTFGPDSYLYWAIGQSGGQKNTSQTLNNPRGKMYRINVDEPSNGKLYSVPDDNPYAKTSSDALKEIWAYGFRNPQKFTFDALTGDLWEMDVGQWLWENLYIVRKGENYGWDIMEGPSCFNYDSERTPLANCNKTGITQSLWSYPHLDLTNSWVNSGVGGFVYRANSKSKLYGVYIFGDFTSHQMFALTQSDRKMTAVKEYGRAPMGPNHFTVDSDGKAYMVGWYKSTTYFQNIDASCQILQLDHPDLLLGATLSVEPKTKRSISATPRTRNFVQLSGVPVGYYRALDAMGREYRAYSGAKPGGNAHAAGIRIAEDKSETQ